MTSCHDVEHEADKLIATAVRIRVTHGNELVNMNSWKDAKFPPVRPLRERIVLTEKHGGQSIGDAHEA